MIQRDFKTELGDFNPLAKLLEIAHTTKDEKTKVSIYAELLKYEFPKPVEILAGFELEPKK